MRRGITAFVPAGLVLALVLAGCGNPRDGHYAAGRTTAAASTGPRTPAPSASSTDGNGSMVPKDLDITTSSNTARGPVIGADVSWPQCPKGMGIPQKRSEGLPMPKASARFVILGLTNGPSFVSNPCLADQVAWVRSRHLWAGAYSVVSYPDAATLKEFGSKGPYDASTQTGRLANVGYRAALFNVATMNKVGLLPPYVWLDVEHVRHFEWSNDTSANAAVVRGAVRGYEAKGLGVGFYSVLSLWHDVVGDLALGLPEWRAAGQTSAREATQRCESSRWSFGGGRGVIGQWVEDHRDLDITCSAAGADLGRWFRRL